MRFDGRVAIVTGAAKGIGAVTAGGFAREGARVAVLDIDGGGVDKVAAGLVAGGTEALALKADATSSADVRAAVETVLARWGRIDVLVNNAGGFAAMRTFEDTSESEWDAILRSNLTSAFLVCKAVLPAMRRQQAGRPPRNRAGSPSTTASARPGPPLRSRTCSWAAASTTGRRRASSSAG